MRRLPEPGPDVAVVIGTVYETRRMALLQTQYDRPPEGLQRGRYAAPPWLVATLGAAVVLGALAFLLWKWRHTRSRSETTPRSSAGALRAPSTMRPGPPSSRRS